MEQRSAVEQDLVLPVSPDELWADLTDPDELACWFGARVEWDLVPGGGARFHDDDGTERTGIIETVEPGRELRFRWWTAGEPETEVQYSLEEVDGGTRLTIVEQEVPAGDAPPQVSASVVDATSMSVAWGIRMAGLWLMCRQPVLV